MATKKSKVDEKAEKNKKEKIPIEKRLIFNKLLLNEPKSPKKGSKSKFQIPDTNIKINDNLIELEVSLPNYIDETLAVAVDKDSVTISCEAQKNGYYTEIKLPENIVPQAAEIRAVDDNIYLDLLKESSNDIWPGIKNLLSTQRKYNETKEKLNNVQKQFHNMQIDYQNLLVRNRNEVENKIDGFKIQIMDTLIKNIDNFELALKATQNKVQNNDQIIKGLKMILNELKNLITDEGVETVPSVGFTLDTSMHEVMECVETDEQPENTILEEYQKGYKYKSRIIRPSKVKVAVLPKKNEKEKKK